MSEEERNGPPGTIACLRCRLRKIRCDRGFPKCSMCEKFGHACLTKDPSSGRIVPRSYLAHLEKRVKELENELSQRSSRSVSTMFSAESDQTYLGGTAGLTFAQIMTSVLHDQLAKEGRVYPERIMGQMGPITVPGQLNSGSKEPEHEQVPPPIHGPQSMAPKTPKYKPGVMLPPKDQAETYLEAYFCRSNPQIPVLHRELFIKSCFEPIYGCVSPRINLASKHTVPSLELRDEEPPTGSFYRRMIDTDGSLSAIPEPRIRVCLYFLFQTMAIGAACSYQELSADNSNTADLCLDLHQSAMQYYSDTINSHDRMLALRALVLLGVYSLMRPAHPGVWYVVGTAMWMCIEMGLHNEERAFASTPSTRDADPLAVDMGRRLFWCTYILDRQVSMYLGRPVSLGDEYIKVPLLSLADDSWLMPEKYSGPEGPPDRPSYKWVAYHMLAIRRIQHKVKYYFYDRADAEKQSADPQALSRLRSMIRSEIDHWYSGLPHESEVFNIDHKFFFFDLNYHQTVLLLYGVSRANPRPLEDDMRIILSAGIKILETYVRISASKCMNYSWVATHNIFQAAASCLYVLHQTRSLNGSFKLEPFKELIKAALDVIDELKSECHAAKSCYDSLELMFNVTIEILQRDLSGINPIHRRIQHQPQIPSPPISSQTGAHKRHAGANEPGSLPEVAGAFKRRKMSDGVVSSQPGFNPSIPVAVDPLAVTPLSASLRIPSDAQQLLHGVSDEGLSGIDGSQPSESRMPTAAAGPMFPVPVQPSKMASYQSPGIAISDLDAAEQLDVFGAAGNVDPSRVYEYFNEMSQMLIWDSFVLPNAGPSA